MKPIEKIDRKRYYYIMSYATTKPKMSSHELIEKMKNEKGIKFKLIKEGDAEKYLTDINNFMRTSSYRKNFPKNQAGKNAGKYIDLDFGYLIELSILDFKFRDIIMPMCIDIEHGLKVKILKEIESNSKIDGYSIVKKFLDRNPITVKNIARTSASAFTSDLINKYFTKDRNNNITNYSDCPIWVLFELIAFGDFLRFYDFYYKYTKIRVPFSRPVLNLVRNLRNACAHNNCLFSNISRRTTEATTEISLNVAPIPKITTQSRRKNLSNRLLLEFCALVFTYKSAVSPTIKKERIKILKELILVRMKKHKNYFQSAPCLIRSYEFAQKVIKYLF